MTANLRARGVSDAQTTGGENTAFRELVRTLDNAYENAVTHKAASSDIESADLLLENASILLSSRMLSAMTQGPCHGDEAGTIEAGTSKCALDDESVRLRDLTDMLSYAANRLEQLAASAGPRDTTETLPFARIRSMEHLYRMTFAISKAHFDPSQSTVYFRAAREQLILARSSLQNESSLCACSSKGYSDRLLELSGVDQLLGRIQPTNTPD